MSEEFAVFKSSSVRRSPFHDATYRDGCRSYGHASYTISDQVYYPGHLFDPVEEYQALVERAVLFDPPVEQPIEISGPDAATYVDHLLTRDMTRCAVGQCRYVILCDQTGAVLLDSVILRLETNRYWLSGDLGWIRGLAAGLGMEVSVFLADAAPLQLQGPNSRDVVDALFGSTVSDLPFYGLVETSVNGMPLFVTRTGWTGERGYEIYLADTTRGVELWDTILEAGKPFGLVATGTSDVRRVEAGILDTQHEACPRHNPFELGFDRLIELDKDIPFVGRDALRAIKEKGVTRRLVGYASTAKFGTGRRGRPCPVSAGGQEIGYATCAVWSHVLERTIGYAMVPLDHTEEGSALTIHTPDGPQAAQVHRVPFVDPDKSRMRGK